MISNYFLTLNFHLTTNVERMKRKGGLTQRIFRSRPGFEPRSFGYARKALPVKLSKHVPQLIFSRSHTNTLIHKYITAFGLKEINFTDVTGLIINSLLTSVTYSII